MKFNCISNGIELLGSVVKNIDVENDIIQLNEDVSCAFGLNINEPSFELNGDKYFAEMTIDFRIEMIQDAKKCNISFSIKGAFVSNDEIREEKFKSLVAVNGAASLICIARGKIEAISANIFDTGKITIPYINVIDYYDQETNTD